MKYPAFGVATVLMCMSCTGIPEGTDGDDEIGGRGGLSVRDQGDDRETLGGRGGDGLTGGSGDAGMGGTGVGGFAGQSGGGGAIGGEAGDGGASRCGGGGAAGTSPAIVASGLVGRWTMDDAVGATVAVDSAGAPDNAALLKSNDASGFVPGKVGGAFAFKANAKEVSPRFRVPASSEINAILDGVTIAMWVYPTRGSGGGGNNPLLMRPTSKGGSYYGLVTKTNNNLSWLGQTSSWGADLPGNVLSDNQWSHVAGTYDRKTSTVVLYLNGRPLGRNTDFKPNDPLASDTSEVQIGESTDAGNWQMDGRLDDVCLYNRALSEAEIQQLYGGP